MINIPYRSARTLRFVVIASALSGAAPLVARAQAAPAAIAPRATADTATVRLAPARPAQGSVLRITVRPPSSLADSAARGDTVPRRRSDGTRADSLAGGAARVDPLRVDPLPTDSLRVDSLRASSLRVDSLRVVAARIDSVRMDSASFDSLRARSLRADSLRLDSLRAAGGRLDSVSTGSAATDSLRALRMRADSLGIDTLRTDSLRGRITAIRGTLFGEPLHFSRDASGSYSALGGIPVDAPRSVRVPVIVERAGAAPDTVEVTLDIARTAYRMEKLTVAPRFGQAPDSALAARIAREQALAAAVSRRSHDTPRLWTGAFARPRTSRVTSRFGDGREFNGRVQSRHMGLDLAGALGAPVLAPDRGVVALVGDFYYAGNAVYIDHGAGLVTAYFHLSEVAVAQGDTVSAGDRIGKVGATGRVTGPHLHWVARYGAVTVDPSTLLDLAPARKEP